ncbi:MAG: cysteine-rich CWC family protein [Burkholderiales bacterium]|nr:cysteine-rich CWC family protein [Burkholderiales bacterium]
MSSLCPRCGASFSCGMEEKKPGTPCWCSQLPPLPCRQMEKLTEKNAEAACYCPNCLRALLRT